MAYFFVLVLLHSFSSHCFPPFSFSPPRENDIFALERAHLCWRSNPYGCIESSRELYIHQRSRQGACLSLRVSKKREVPLVNILRGRIFSYSSAASRTTNTNYVGIFRCEMVSLVDARLMSSPPPPTLNTYLRTGEINEGE